MVTKSERIGLMATRAQAASWRLAAESAGVSLSELLRQAAERLVREMARRPEPAPR